MDATTFLPRFINIAQLESQENRYENVIADVVAVPTQNTYTHEKKPELTIFFDDGYRVIPNKTMLKALIKEYGKETNLWIGRRIILYSCLVNESQRRTEHRSAKKQKCVMFPQEEISRSGLVREAR